MTLLQHPMHTLRVEDIHRYEVSPRRCKFHPEKLDELAGLEGRGTVNRLPEETRQ